MEHIWVIEVLGPKGFVPSSNAAPKWTRQLARKRKREMDETFQNEFRVAKYVRAHLPPDDGMTLLDWFAGQVVVGIHAGNAEAIARVCYDRAAALVAEKHRRFPPEVPGE